MVLYMILRLLTYFENYFYKLEQDTFNQLMNGSIPKAKLKLKKSAGERVLSEMAKQGLIELTKNGHSLTNLGNWYHQSR